MPTGPFNLLVCTSTCTYEQALQVALCSGIEVQINIQSVGEWVFL